MKKLAGSAGTAQFDCRIRQRFEDLYHACVGQSVDVAVVPATRALVTIIVLDQLTRNMFRGRPEAFRADALARAIAAEGLGAASGDPEYTRFAIAHRDIIARFGRLPHRNAILGRQSSAEEDAFLKHPGSSI